MCDNVYGYHMLRRRHLASVGQLGRRQSEHGEGSHVAGSQAQPCWGLSWGAPKIAKESPGNPRKVWVSWDLELIYDC